MTKLKINPIDPDELICDLANGIAKYSIEKFGSVDLEAIAYSNNLKFSYGNYGNCFDGLLEWIYPKFHIYINQSGNSGRDRFTFGHELGHFFIPNHSLAMVNGHAPAHCSFTGYKSEKEIERQADYFASNLLMPFTSVKKVYYQERKFKFETIEKISQIFEVSLLAALYRVFFLNLHPLMIVRSKNGKICGSPAFNENFYHRLESTYEIPKDSMAANLLEATKERNKTKELWLMDWFDTNSDEFMFERSFYTGYNSEIISVLWTD